VTGAENIPESGGAILAANHLSAADSVFLPLMVSRPGVGWLALKSGLPVIPVALSGQPPAKARRQIADQVMAAIQQLSGQEYVDMFASDRKAELAAAQNGTRPRS
jgi:1-acyl-sn-glycerol-3-phosphate acyltransferase